jgi:nicotinamide-nucleotide amidase
VEKDGKIVLAMPGPPGEMERMWQKEIIPRLKERMAGTVIASKTLKTFGISEAKVDEMVSPLLSSSNPTIGIYAKPDGIQLRLTAKAETQEKAEAMLAPLEQGVRAILGSAVWGVDEDTLEAIIGTLLVEKGLTLATMESCTGGLLATTITDVPGSSRYFRGGLVAYSNEMKVAWGVDAALIEQHGAVSPQVAEAMALAVRSRLGADIGIGITGVAGPDELEGKRAGTVHIAVLQGKDGKDKRVLNPLYPPRRPDVKRRATVAAIIMLRQLLLGLPIP